MDIFVLFLRGRIRSPEKLGNSPKVTYSMNGREAQSRVLPGPKSCFSVGLSWSSNAISKTGWSRGSRFTGTDNFPLKVGPQRSTQLCLPHQHLESVGKVGTACKTMAAWDPMECGNPEGHAG